MNSTTTFLPLLMALERMLVERARLLLHDVLGLDFEIAATIDEAGVPSLASRARLMFMQDRPRYAGAEEQAGGAQKLLAAFRTATSSACGAARGRRHRLRRWQGQGAGYDVTVTRLV